MTTLREDLNKIIRSPGTPESKAIAIIGHLYGIDLLSTDWLADDPKFSGGDSPDAIGRAYVEARRILSES